MSYQTYKKSSGEIVKGVYDTPLFFSKILPHLSLGNKSVIDYGCGEGMYTVLAHKRGAFSTTGVDENPESFSPVLHRDHGIDYSVVDLWGRPHLVDLENLCHITLGQIIDPDAIHVWNSLVSGEFGISFNGDIVRLIEELKTKT